MNRARCLQAMLPKIGKFFKVGGPPMCDDYSGTMSHVEGPRAPLHVELAGTTDKAVKSCVWPRDRTQTHGTYGPRAFFRSSSAGAPPPNHVWQKA